MLYVLDVPDSPERPDSGKRLAGVDDVNGDAVPDIAVEPSTRGPVALFSGVDGTFLSNRERLDLAHRSVLARRAGLRRSQADLELRRVAGDLVIADESGDGVSDIAVRRSI